MKTMKTKNSQTIHQLTVSTQTYTFLKKFCPHSMTVSLAHTDHKPKSKYITLFFDADKVDCILKVVGDADLVENVNAKIEKDLRNLIRELDTKI